MDEVNNQPKSTPEVEMTFLEHLEELRGRIIKSVIGVCIGLLICLIFTDTLVNVILISPAKHAGLELQNIRPFGQIFLYFQVAMIGGIILSLPNLFYQFWKFISPALRPSERKYVTSIVVYSTFCFLCGISFAYFVMLPMTFGFVAKFGSTYVKNQFAVDEYMSIVLSILLTAGLVFELPMISFFLSKIGILKPTFMRKYRRHAIIIILLLAAVLTPGTDPVSQLILAIPLFILYEISIIVSKFSTKKTQDT